MPQSLKDLITSISESSAQEVAELVRGIRHNKLIAKPAAQRRARKAETNQRKQRSTKMGKLVSTMSDEERAALIEMLEQQDD